MAERPILFRDDMVRAILDGRKTVTRRVGPTWARAKAGERLWVREAWNVGEWCGGESARIWFVAEAKIPKMNPPALDVIYRGEGIPGCADVPAYRPSIHMPRWACRIELEVVSVTEQPGRGCNRPDWPELCMCAWSGCAAVPDVDDDEARREGVADRAAFIALWLSMHAHHSGPVYRVEFRRVP